MTVNEIVEELKAFSNEKSIEGMKRFGITPHKTYGVKVPVLRDIAKRAGRHHQLAKELWKIDTRETMILTSMIEEICCVSKDDMEKYIAHFDYWEICDQFCMNLFSKVGYTKHNDIIYFTKKMHPEV